MNYYSIYPAERPHEKIFIMTEAPITPNCTFRVLADGRDYHVGLESASQEIAASAKISNDPDIFAVFTINPVKPGNESRFKFYKAEVLNNQKTPNKTAETLILDQKMDTQQILNAIHTLTGVLNSTSINANAGIKIRKATEDKITELIKKITV